MYVFVCMYIYVCMYMWIHMYALPEMRVHREYFGRHLCVGDTRENIACCLCSVAPHTPVHILYNISTILHRTSRKHMMIHKNIMLHYCNIQHCVLHVLHGTTHTCARLKYHSYIWIIIHINIYEIMTYMKIYYITCLWHTTLRVVCVSQRTTHTCACLK